MIAQAEHIPVHLGAMPDAVAAVDAHDPAPGEVWILNDPYAGGTHLPDVTMVSRTALGFAVSRAHHADVGGGRAGQHAGGLAHARRGRSRDPADAARRRHARGARRAHAQPGGAARRLPRAARRASPRRASRRRALRTPRARDRVAAAMDELYAYSERVVRAGARAHSPTAATRRRTCSKATAASSSIRAAVTIAGDGIEIDFAGTAPQHDGNLNCPLAVTRSACYFVVRCLTDARRPCVRRSVRARDRDARPRAGSSTRARPRPSRPATSRPRAGSWTSSSPRSRRRSTVPAQGQGTMNNVTLGNERFTYYETIGGGQGACPDADGPSGVHVAMSNTLTTPVEALELQYPLRVERYALRLGSGGAGDGTRRRRRRPRAARARGRAGCRCSPSAARTRRAAPRGGGDGAPRAQPPERRELPAKATRRLDAGDVSRSRRRRRRLRPASRVCVVAGRVEAINIGPSSRSCRRRSTASAPIAGKGLEGNRYFFDDGAPPGTRAHADRRRGARGEAAEHGIPIDAARVAPQRAHARDRPERARRRALPGRRRRVRRRRAVRAVHAPRERDAARRDQGRTCTAAA